MQTLLKLVLSFLAFGIFTVSNARADGMCVQTKLCAEGYVCAMGQGTSENMDVSMDKARLDAEFGLAEQFKNFVSGQVRHKEGANDERIVTNLVAGVSLSGYQVVSQEITPVQGKFHTRILLRIAVR